MRPLSKKLLNFHVEVERMAKYMTDANRARLRITPEQHAQFTGLMDRWSKAYFAYINPETHTPPVVLAINRVYDEFIVVVRAIRRQLKNDPNLHLTGDDYLEMGIHMDKPTRTRSVIPDFAPVITQIKINHLANEFEVRRPTSEDIEHLALPKGYKVSRKLAIVDPGSPPPLTNAYKTIDSVGHGRFTLNFSPADEGRVGYIICAYANRREESGPPSSPLKFYIN